MSQPEIITALALLPADTATVLRDTFKTWDETAADLAKKARTIVVTSSDQVALMETAKESRLALRRIRLDTEEKREKLKLASRQYREAVDEQADKIVNAITPIEAYLKQQEEFAKREAEGRRLARVTHRSAKLREMGVNPALYQIAEMEDAAWDELVLSLTRSQAAEREARRLAAELELSRRREAAQLAESQRLARIEESRMAAESVKVMQARLATYDSPIGGVVRGQIGAGPIPTAVPIFHRKTPSPTDDDGFDSAPPAVKEPVALPAYDGFGDSPDLNPRTGRTVSEQIRADESEEIKKWLEYLNRYQIHPFRNEQCRGASAVILRQLSIMRDDVNRILSE